MEFYETGLKMVGLAFPETSYIYTCLKFLYSEHNDCYSLSLNFQLSSENLFAFSLVFCLEFSLINMS